MRWQDIECISDLYYVIGRWFTLIAVVAAFAIMPLALDKSEGIWSFSMCAGIAFVGIAANYRDSTTYPVHYLSACISAVGCITFASIVCPLSLFALAVGVIGAIDRKRWLLWCEIGCFLTATIALAT